METAAKGLRQLMTGLPMTVRIYEMEKPDVGLGPYGPSSSMPRPWDASEPTKLYGSLAGELVDFVIRGGHPNLRLDDNGLLYAEGREEPITWMNSTANGQPVVPRTGYIVEINALWYNALRFVASMKREFGDAGEADRLDQLAERTKGAFVETFLNEYGYLYDYVDGAMADWSVRPNMIFAAAFDYSPLNERQKKGIVDICTRELLTPKGLRTLSPKSGGIQPDVCRTADAEGLRLPSGHGMALAGGILYRGLPETLQAVAHQLRGATDGGLRGPGAPTLRGHATRALRRQPALQGTRGHLLRHERRRGAARQRIARKV